MDTVTVGKLSGQYARGRNVLGKARYKGRLTCVSRTSHQEKGLEKQSMHHQRHVVHREHQALP